MTGEVDVPLEEPPAPPALLWALLAEADHQAQVEEGDDFHVIDMDISPVPSPVAVTRRQQEGEHAVVGEAELSVRDAPLRLSPSLPARHTQPHHGSPTREEALPGTSRASEPVYPVGTLMARRREQIRRAALAAAAQQADPEVLDLRIARQQPPATPPPAARPQARIVTPDIFRPSPERQGESPGAVRPPATPGRRSPTPPLAATPPIPARPHTPDNDDLAVRDGHRAGERGRGMRGRRGQVRPQQAGDADGQRRGPGRPRLARNSPPPPRRPVGRPRRVPTGDTPPPPPRRPRGRPRLVREGPGRGAVPVRGIVPIDVSDEDSPDEAEQAQRVLADVGPDDVVSISSEDEEAHRPLAPVPAGAVRGRAAPEGPAAPAPPAALAPPAGPAARAAQQLQEFRQVRAEQDAAYEVGLAADRERDRQRQQAEAQQREEAAAADRVQEALTARRAAASAAMATVADGGAYEIQFVFPSGHRWMRSFEAHCLLSLVRTAVETNAEAPWGFRVLQADGEAVESEYGNITIRDFFGDSHRQLVHVQEVDAPAPPPAAAAADPPALLDQAHQEAAAQAAPEEPGSPQPDGPRPEGACCYCFDAPAVVAAVTCGHLSMCTPCSETVKSGPLRGRRCCYCRERIRIYLKITFAHEHPEAAVPEGACHHCLNARAVVACEPCGHLSMCLPCSETVRARRLRDRKCCCCGEHIRIFQNIIFT